MDVKQLIEILNLVGHNQTKENCEDSSGRNHPTVGKFYIIRTYSAGVHFGIVESVKGTEVILSDAYRMWRWLDGGLSLSAVARNGMKGGRVNKTGDVTLTQAIEIIPTSDKFKSSYQEFLEDE